MWLHWNSGLCTAGQCGHDCHVVGFPRGWKSPKIGIVTYLVCMHWTGLRTGAVNPNVSPDPAQYDCSSDSVAH